MSLRIFSLLAASVLAIYSASADGFTRLRFNHPGLTVDLAVGLWAWPVPCDADGDGDPDLIVVCPDKPYNGTYLFENTTGKGAKMPVFKAARRLGKAVHYATPSYVGGKLRVLTPGHDAPVKLPPPANIHNTPVGGKPGVFKRRHNQWRYVDFDGDGALALVGGAEDGHLYFFEKGWPRT